MDPAQEILKTVTKNATKVRAELEETTWQLHLAHERIERLVRENNDLRHAKLTVGRIIQRLEDHDRALPIISIQPTEQGVQIIVGS